MSLRRHRDTEVVKRFIPPREKTMIKNVALQFLNKIAVIAKMLLIMALQNKKRRSILEMIAYIILGKTAKLRK